MFAHRARLALHAGVAFALFFNAFCKYKQKDRPATNRGIFEMKIKNDLLKASFTSPRRIAIGIGFLIVIAN